MRSIAIAISLTILCTIGISAQSEGMKTGNANSIVSLDAQDKGILIPRMTSSEKNAISNAVPGLIVYQTDGEKGIYQFNGTKWISVGHNPDPYQVSNGIGMDGNTIKINIPNQNVGDMFYYDGNQWIRITKGQEGQRLSIVNGIPTWID